MSSFDHPDDLPDPSGFSDWDLANSIQTIAGLHLLWPTYKAYHHLLLIELRREAHRRGLDGSTDIRPTDLSHHCPATHPVV